MLLVLDSRALLRDRLLSRGLPFLSYASNLSALNYFDN